MLAFDKKSFYQVLVSLIEVPKIYIWTIILFSLCAIFVYIYISDKLFGKITESEKNYIWKEYSTFLWNLFYDFYALKIYDFNLTLLIPFAFFRFNTLYFEAKLDFISTMTRPPSVNQHHFNLIAELLLFLISLSSTLKYIKGESIIRPFAIVYCIDNVLITSRIIVRHILIIFTSLNHSNQIFKYQRNLDLVFAILFLFSAINCLMWIGVFSINYIIKVYNIISNYIAWRKTLKKMEKIPNATESDLERDNICIICRNELDMIDGKRLPCGHCIHSECLQQWAAEHQQCPLCKTPFHIDEDEDNYFLPDLHGNQPHDDENIQRHHYNYDNEETTQPHNIGGQEVNIHVVKVFDYKPLDNNLIIYKGKDPNANPIYIKRVKIPVQRPNSIEFNDLLRDN